MGLLQFALVCIDFLAWPVIALGYPLFVSIRAVETGSKYDMKKSVIYWTLFYSISLFEFAFVKIIEWIPFWSSIRLIAIFWLVIPCFDGACCAYKSLVRPVLYVNIKAVIGKFYMPKEEKPSKRETFLDVAEKYIKENGSEALERLIASKNECKECENSQRDSQVLELEEKNAAGASKQEDLTRVHALRVVGKPRRATKIISVWWRPPSMGWIKVNTDGSARGIPGPCTCSGVFRDCYGQTRGCFNLSLERGFAFEAELVAAMYAVEIAAARGWNAIWLESDSSYVISLFTSGSHTVPRYFKNRWLKVLHLISTMSVTFSHIYREGNQVADAISKLDFFFPWADDCPHSINHLVVRDMQGLPFYRFRH